MSAINKNPDNVQTVNSSRHGKLKVKSDSGFGHAKDRNIVAVNLSELGISASNFPIAFIQNPDDNRFLMVAILGLRPGENNFYGKEFWSSTYVPLAIQRHPFVIGYDDQVTDVEEITTCLEIDSPLLGEKDGNALFNEEGKATDFLSSKHQLLNTIFEGEKRTEQMIDKLVELDLMTALQIELKQQNGDARKVRGLYTLDEVKLKNLSAEQLKELQVEDFLPPCYLILGSLYQLQHLIKKRNLKNAEQIVNFRIQFGEVSGKGE